MYVIHVLELKDRIIVSNIVSKTALASCCLSLKHQIIRSIENILYDEVCIESFDKCNTNYKYDL